MIININVIIIININFFFIDLLWFHEANEMFFKLVRAHLMQVKTNFKNLLQHNSALIVKLKLRPRR